jgi:exonuclease VII small subunit
MKKSNISPDITKLSFEEALEQLEDIVSDHLVLLLFPF